MSIVRGVLYFDGRGPIAGPVLCLVGWAAGGVALLAIRAWRAGRSETDGTAAGPADTAGRAENTTGTSPARTAEPLGAV
jgi:hypothetical protein